LFLHAESYWTWVLASIIPENGLRQNSTTNFESKENVENQGRVVVFLDSEGSSQSDSSMGSEKHLFKQARRRASERVK
jgi:hypothetical protein